MTPPRIVVQTAYAELLDRCSAAAFRSAFPDNGTFVVKTIKGRRYWYFQQPASLGRTQMYAGPETSELLERISQHQRARDDEAQRRSLVSALLRIQRSPRPSRDIGRVVKVLAEAGVFRLRGVLVGTVAYQTYGPMLGVSFGGAGVGTEDVDIAQFRDVSVAVGESTRPAIELLREADDTFRPVPHMVDGRKVTRYQAQNGLRVDFLTPNRGPAASGPSSLPALRTDAEPLRFLDFLIRDPEPAVVLHDAGIYVMVPTPERFAVHKLIVSRRRSSTSAKRDKDILQAASLLEILAEKRPFELQEAWREARARGQVWRKLIDEAVTVIPERTREATLAALQTGATSRRK